MTVSARIAELKIFDNQEIKSSFQYKQTDIETLEHSYQISWEIFKENSKSFSFAAKFLSEEKRKSLAAVYSFFRLIDDLVDVSNLCREEIKQQLDQNKWIISEISRGNLITSHPIYLALRDTILRYRIPKEVFYHFIDGIELDLRLKEIQSEEELNTYSYHVASTVGIIFCFIFGVQNPKTLERAAALGIAMQRTNCLRDIAEDYSKGRIYIPKETRRSFGVKGSDLSKKRINSNLKKLLIYEINQARNWYNKAELGIKDLPSDAAFVTKLASRVYAEILNEIERMNYEVLQKRAIVSKVRKIIIFLKLKLVSFF